MHLRQPKISVAFLHGGLYYLLPLLSDTIVIFSRQRRFQEFSGLHIVDGHRAGRDDVTTGKLFPSRGECLGLYRCVLIIFKRK